MQNKAQRYKFHFWFFFVLSAIVIQIPIVSIPFSWIETFFHEISHGLATLITGGTISKIQLLANGAGYCYSYGGWPILIAFSGYAGASGFGLLLYQLAATTTSKFAKFISIAIILLIAICLALWVRDLLTVLILLVIASLFILPLKFASSGWLKYLTQFISMTVILNGLFSAVMLIGRGHVGDAANLAKMTWLPAQVWTVCWCIIGCFALYRAFKVR
ncbi:M50 family metallopeptidase [Shewanella sp. 202IG2-18]|uniref:M50 family metallopeptidase n=1 Tax=Parashewanella hymeniacidonis TaxID=2807618 RepID=UPI0019610C2F|nr:M50 family metallopeptidase [Parashewanella hymeniacidonis]MBM7072706.1 M50 family metallopeptidase [Parashewanella hymeniacidonis]